MQAMPIIKNANADGSPHAWGDQLKTHYTTHLAAGLGHISTVEGVTCISDDIDYGNYPLKRRQNFGITRAWIRDENSEAIRMSKSRVPETGDSAGTYAGRLVNFSRPRGVSGFPDSTRRGDFFSGLVGVMYFFFF
jgi:hypothetical protein